MAKRNSRNTRGRIISAAWKLFYEQGYDGTTVEDIVFESGTSKCSSHNMFCSFSFFRGTKLYSFLKIDKKKRTFVRFQIM